MDNRSLLLLTVVMVILNMFTAVACMLLGQFTWGFINAAFAVWGLFRIETLKKQTGDSESNGN